MKNVIEAYPSTGASVIPDLPDLDFLGPVDDDPTCGLLNEIIEVCMAIEDDCLTVIEDVKSKHARLQGYVASEQAYSIHQNPYPMGVIAHAWWEAGHSEATDDLCGRGC